MPPVLVTAEDVNHGKHDPEGYTLAAGRLGYPQLDISSSRTHRLVSTLGSVPEAT